MPGSQSWSYGAPPGSKETPFNTRCSAPCSGSNDLCPKARADLPTRFADRLSTRSKGGRGWRCARVTHSWTRSRRCPAGLEAAHLRAVSVSPWAAARRRGAWGQFRWHLFCSLNVAASAARRVGGHTLCAAQRASAVRRRHFPGSPWVASQKGAARKKNVATSIYRHVLRRSDRGYADGRMGRGLARDACRRPSRNGSFPPD